MGLREDILKDSVDRLHLRALIAVGPRTPTGEVAAKMREHHLGCAIVVDLEGRPIGKFTERRLMRALLDDGSSALGQPVQKYMYDTADPVGRQETIAAMIARMQRGHKRFMCVTDAQGKAVALTGQKGLMEYVAEHFSRQIKVQRMKPLVSMPEKEGA